MQAKPQEKKCPTLTDGQIGQLLLESYREILELRRKRLAAKGNDKAVSDPKNNG